MKLKTNLCLSALTGLMIASGSALATEKGDILVRSRVINIAPNVSSGQINNTTGGAFSPPSGIDVESKTTLDIDFTYMVSDHVGIELLLDLSSTHDIVATGSLAGLGKIGEVTVLPPSLIAQYHFTPHANVRPYVGAGINYTFFFNEKTTDSLTTGLGAASTSHDVKDTFSYLVQAGVDIDIDKTWFLNIDAKYFFMDTTATISANGAEVVTVGFDLDPLVVGVGVGMRF